MRHADMRALDRIRPMAVQSSRGDMAVAIDLQCNPSLNCTVWLATAASISNVPVDLNVPVALQKYRERAKTAKLATEC